MDIKEFIVAENVDEAYSLLNSQRNNVILGGCCFLRMGKKSVNKGIDLSKLGFNFIKETMDTIEIGSMTSFREIETDPITKKHFDGILSNSVKNIVGVQMRNLVTVGGTVYSRYGFSDFITALLVLDVSVELYKGGTMTLEDFLEKGCPKDILIKLIIRKDNRKSVFLDMRNSSSDYAILNLAVSNLNNNFKIAVGGRPGRAKLALIGSKFLSENTIDEFNIKNAADMVASELVFGSNMRGSKEYRTEICKVLARRGIMEVIL